MGQSTIAIAFLSVCLTLSASGAPHSVKAAAADGAAFVRVDEVAKGVLVDLAYAREDNFFKRKFYPENVCYLRRSTALKLANVQADLESQGFGLKVLDGYRPPSVQREMWRVKPDPRYVASPENGSRHNRGAAVDVTLVDESGTELQMPTAFDDFSEMAASDYVVKLPKTAIRNRKILQDAMTRHGFAILASEWWHFDDVDWKKYPMEERSPDAGETAVLKGVVADADETAVLTARVAQLEALVEELRKRVEALEAAAKSRE